MELAAIIISGISLILSIVSLVGALKSQHLQNRVNKIEIKLKEYQLEATEKEQLKVPVVEARIIHIIKNQYRIKVWNSGNGIAKNVVASWDEISGIIYFDRAKMPFELLEPQKSFELTISAYDGAPSKLCITTEWENEQGERHTKKQWCDM